MRIDQKEVDEKRKLVFGIAPEEGTADVGVGFEHSLMSAT